MIRFFLSSLLLFSSNLAANFTITVEFNNAISVGISSNAPIAIIKRALDMSGLYDAKIQRISIELDPEFSEEDVDPLMDLLDIIKTPELVGQQIWQRVCPLQHPFWEIIFDAL